MGAVGPFIFKTLTPVLFRGSLPTVSKQSQCVVRRYLYLASSLPQRKAMARIDTFCMSRLHVN